MTVTLPSGTKTTSVNDDGSVLRRELSPEQQREAALVALQLMVTTTSPVNPAATLSDDEHEAITAFTQSLADVLVSLQEVPDFALAMLDLAALTLHDVFDAEVTE